MFEIIVTCEQTGVVEEVTETFNATGLRMAVLSDPIGPDSVSVVSQPATGRAVNRPDAKVGVDLLDQDPDGNLIIVYDREKDGVTQRVTATLIVAPAPEVNGWGLGDGYCPPFDYATGKTIVEPSQNTRRVYVSNDGLTAAAIASLEGVTEGTITTTWLRDNPATGAGGLYYGESEDLPLN
ncbi:hypothetical protein ACFO5X_14090, partial [Seohaeicola nanhaiensis]